MRKNKGKINFVAFGFYSDFSEDWLVMMAFFDFAFSLIFADIGKILHNFEIFMCYMKEERLNYVQFKNGLNRTKNRDMAKRGPKGPPNLRSSQKAQPL